MRGRHLSATAVIVGSAARNACQVLHTQSVLPLPNILCLRARPDSAQHSTTQHTAQLESPSLATAFALHSGPARPRAFADLSIPNPTFHTNTDHRTGVIPLFFPHHPHLFKSLLHNTLSPTPPPPTQHFNQYVRTRKRRQGSRQGWC